MSELFAWFLGIPETLARFGDWLTSPISAEFQVSPLVILGTGALTALVAIIGFKVVHLVNPFG